MAVVITSTTSSQADMEHAVSDEWRQPQEEKEAAPAPIQPEKEPEVPPEEPEAPPEPKEPEREPDKLAAKPKEHKSGWQKRIDKLTARNHQIETENARIRAEFEQFKAQAAAKPEEAAKPAEGPREPKRSDFEEGDPGLEKFLAARDKWKDDSAIQAEKIEQQKAINENYNRRASEALGRYDDWSEVVSAADIVMPTPALDAIKEADNGPDIAYYLARHPDEAVALNDLTPIKAIQAIAKISEKVAAELVPVSAPPKPKAKAPAPIAPVGNSATRVSTMEELPISEFIRIRNKQEREKRRGY